MEWINRVIVGLDFQDFAVFADQDIGALSGFVFVAVKSVLAGNVSTPIAEQGKLDASLFGEGVIGEGAIHAYTQNLGVRSFQLVETLLEVLHLQGSTTGEGEHVEAEDDIFLAAKVGQ